MNKALRPGTVSCISLTGQLAIDWSISGAIAAAVMVATTDIRIPLAWKERRQRKHFGGGSGISSSSSKKAGSSSQPQFAVFCLLRVASEVYDSQLLMLDDSMTDACFDDVAVFDCLPPDFDLHLELYCHAVVNSSSSMSEQVQSSSSSSSSLLHRPSPSLPALTLRLTSSMSRTLGRKLMASLKEVDQQRNDVG